MQSPPRKGVYQYTAVDDCTRYRVLGLAADKTAASTLRFLDQLLAAMPFPIQRIQTDRGAEFFAYEVQERLMRERIRFRPIRPRSPHLNGKVERSQRTDLDEFWPMSLPRRLFPVRRLMGGFPPRAEWGREVL